MTTILTFLLFIIFFVWLLALTIDVHAEPDESVWATNDIFGTRLVPIYYVDQPITSQGDEVLGFYNPNDDYIEIKIGYAEVWARQGGTIRDHEILHAWGYSHRQMHVEVNVDNPNENLNAGIYDSKNIKHWNPHYKWSGYFD